MRNRRLLELALPLLAALLGSAGEARAAPVAWGGAGDGVSFEDPANWDPPGVPGASDAVSIASSVLVLAGPSYPLNLSSLTLGDGLSSPTLRLSTGTLYVGALVVKASATFEADTADVSYFGTVTVESGGLLTHTGPSAATATASALLIQAARFEVQAGATVSVTGKGMSGGSAFGTAAGPGGGWGGDIITGGGGGGHGGTGGRGGNALEWSTVGRGGSAMDSPTLPSTVGGGGGGAASPCYGGPGGGVFHLQAATTVVNGLIEADGATGASGCSTVGGGGAGGTVRLLTEVFDGTGTIRADGGTGAGSPTGTGGGGGSGGRVAVYATGTLAGGPLVSANPGPGGAGVNAGSYGQPGSTFIDPKVWVGGGGGNCSDPLNWFGRQSPQSSENAVFGSTRPTAGCSWDLVMIGGSLGSLTLGPEYQGVVNWTSVISSVAGNFNIYGGTLTMNTGVEMRLGGDWVQTGGTFQLNQGTVTFAGAGAQSIVQTAGSYFNELTVQGTSGSVSPGSDLEVRGGITTGARWLNSGHSVSVAGAVYGPFHRGMGTTAWVLAGTSPQTVSTGPYYALSVLNPAGAAFSGSTVPVVGPGGLRIGPGGTLDVSNKTLTLYGGLVDDGGALSTGGGTLLFLGSGSDVFLSSGAALNNVDIRKPAGSLLWSSSATVGGSLLLRANSILRLVDGATLAVRGAWTQNEGSLLDGSSGTVVFDGSAAQVVFSSGASAFHHFIASNTSMVRLSAGAAVDGDLWLARGGLDISSVTLRVRGGLLRRGGSLPGIKGSTVVYEGTGLQTLELGAGTPELDSLVIGNSGGGVVMGGDLLLRRNFTVLPGAVFDGSSRTLTLAGAGARLDTAGADYRSPGYGAHTLRLDPSIPSTGTAVSISTGSALNARLEILRRVVGHGGFSLAGSGNSLYLGPGASLDSRGSTVTLGGGCDAVFSTGTAYLHDGGSWLVFEGSGTGRGAQLSTGPFGGLRLRGDASATFLLGTISLDGDLALESGTLLNAGTATLTLKGSVSNDGGVLAFSGGSTGTFRMAGSAVQPLRLRPGDALARLEVASSSSVVLGASLSVGDLRLSSGTLAAGTALLDLKGSWQGTGGRFQADSSTVSFSSAGAGAAQSYSDTLGASFNGLSVGVSTLVFSSTFSAAVLTSTRPAALLVFSPVAGGDYRVSDLRLAGGLPSSRVRLRSAAPGTPFRLDVVGVSTVTAADVRDSSATGRVVHANDGTSLDMGGNARWNFHANLVLLAPGEGFTEGSGKTGLPSLQTAGSTFTVTVMAVSDAWRRVETSTISVWLETSDGFDAEPPPRALSGGATEFTVLLREAEPYPRTAVLTAASSGAFSTASVALRVDPAAFDRLQLLLPGESALPGSDYGRTGLPSPQIAGLPFAALVRGTDRFFNLVGGASDSVAVATVTASSAVFPSPAGLAGGQILFQGLRMYTTGTFLLTARDISNPAVAWAAFSTMSIFEPNSSSPTLAFQVPSGARVSSLGGALAGTATDAVAVAEVKVAFRDNASMLYRDWSLGAFSSASPLFRQAARTPLNGQRVDWEVPLPDASLTSGREYYAVMVATNPSGHSNVLASTFTFDTGPLSYTLGGGEGSALLAPSSTEACRPVVSTLNFTVGASGIGPGGAVALRLPEGWTRPEGRHPGPTPPLGFVTVLSTSTAWPGSVEVRLNPPELGSTVLGDGWVAAVVYSTAPAGLRPGENIRFIVQALPSGGLGTRAFDTRSSSGAGTPLTGIASIPAMVLTAGPARAMRFDGYAPMTLGPLQPSATMRLELTDACGAPSPVQAQTLAYVSAAVPSGSGRLADARAEFYLAGGGPAASVRIASGSSVSEAFYYRTSTAGVSAELVRATAALSGSEALAERLVSLRASSAAPTGIFVSTASLAAGSTSVALRPGEPGARAFIRFSLADPALDWEVVLSTAADFCSPVFRRTGRGDPARVIETSFDGLSCDGADCRFVPPGAYRARVRSGGASDDLSLEIRVLPTPSIRGSLGPGGAGARVRAEGPGAGPGNTAEAASSGDFEIFGLRAGSVYVAAASTRVLSFGLPVELSTRSAPATAILGGGDAGSPAFPVPARLRLSAMLPVASAEELWGTVLARGPGGREGRGTLHFPAGGASSDDGTRLAGQAASTWTALALEPGLYDLELEVPGVGISSRIAGVSLGSGAMADMALRLARHASVSGRVRLPAPAPSGVGITVEARKAGEALAGAYASAFVPPPSGGVVPSSAPFRLYGLSPGTWTVRAAAQGYVAASTDVFVAGGEDIGVPASGLNGPHLELGRGAVLAGTVSVRGWPAGRPAPTVLLEAYEPAGARLSRATVILSTGVELASAAYVLGGLEPGAYRLSAFLKDFETDPPGPLSVLVSSAGASADMELRPLSSRFILTVRLPRPASPCRCAADFSRVGLLLRAPGELPRAWADVTSLAAEYGSAFTFNESSMTFVSPPLGGGFHELRLLNGASGSAALVVVPLARGATASVEADLRGSTFTVSGAVSLSGSLHLRKGAYSVSVSSIPGLVSQAATTSYCLLSSSSPVPLSSARVELVPWESGEGAAPLLRAAGASCARPEPGAEERRLLAYAGAIGPDGRYSIAGVPAGTYELRVPADLDGDPAGTPEMSPVTRVVRVSGDAAEDVSLRPGARVSGEVRLPPGIPLDRPFQIMLSDKDGRPSAWTVERSYGRERVPFALENVPDGRHALSFRDMGFPTAFAARPLSVEVSGDLEGLVLKPGRAGAIKGRIVVERPAPGGGVEPLAVTASDRGVLPRGLRVSARAVPWAEGGILPAALAQCGEPGCPLLALDAEGRFTVPDVLAGSYDLDFDVAEAGEDARSASLDLVSERLSGISVGEGQTVDVGVVRLRASAALSGRVTDGQGRGLANVPVEARPSAGTPGKEMRAPGTLTDPEGSYVLSGLDPEVRFYDLTAAPARPGTPLPYAAMTVPQVDIRSTTTLDFSLLDARLSVSGRVASDTGAPLLSSEEGAAEPGALVFVQRDGVEPRLNAFGDTVVRTDPDGRFSLGGLWPGSYRVTATALDHAELTRLVAVSSVSLDLGNLTLGRGATLEGSILGSDGTAPSRDELDGILAMRGREVVQGVLNSDANTRAVTGYRLSGLRAGEGWRLALLSGSGELSLPDEGALVVFSSSVQARRLDLVFRRARPFVMAKARRSGSGFLLEFQTTHPLRSRTTADADAASWLSTVSARGTLGAPGVSSDRRSLVASYAPAVGESSFTLRLRGRSAFRDPDSTDGSDPEFLIESTATFFSGLDGFHRTSIANAVGGELALEDDFGRLSLPRGAFLVSASSSVEVSLRKTRELLRDSGALQARGLNAAEANLRSLRFSPGSYPSDLLRAMAATPPQTSPKSAFYDVSLPPGTRSGLARPAKLTLAYDAGADPSKLNVYWYNEAANAYILQQDVTGAGLEIDRGDRTVAVRVDHFSTFVLFEAGVAAISGSANSGEALEAFNFPNPFDLQVKTVTPIHGVPPQDIRGTMIRVAVPSGVHGGGAVRIFNAAGERVRSLDLGEITGGRYYYQTWDGRNDSGRDVASGVYIGQVRVGGRSAFFKMAVVK